MKALIDLRSNTNWAELYFDTDCPITLTLNGHSLIRYYFNKLSRIGVRVVEVVLSCGQENLGYIEGLARAYGFDLTFLVRDPSVGDTYFWINSNPKNEYDIIIEGAMYIPHVKILKRLMKKQSIFMGEYRDNIGGASSCLMTLSDYYRHMIKCINPKDIIRNDRTEVIGTLFAQGIEFGKGLYFKDKIIVKDRIIDPINNFFLQIEDRNIITIRT